MRSFCCAWKRLLTSISVCEALTSTLVNEAMMIVRMTIATSSSMIVNPLAAPARVRALGDRALLRWDPCGAYRRRVLRP